MKAIILSGLLLPLWLGACADRKPDAAAIAAVEQKARAERAEDGRVSCAKPGATAMARDCTVEQSAEEGGLILTLRHPDGGFRRLLVLDDGRGVIAADGAEATEVTVMGRDRIMVAIAGERYELPATVKGGGARQ